MPTEHLESIINRYVVPYCQGKRITGKPTLVFLAELFPRAFSSRVSTLMRCCFFSPPNKSSFHTTSRLRLHKQTDGEGGGEGSGERASISRQRFTHSAHCYAGKKKLHQNSHDRAELLSQNETSVEEAGSVCLLLRSA